MNLKHAKSQCCGVKIYRFGRRRKQCSKCKRTWRGRPQKRGRRAHRVSSVLMKRVFLETFSLRQLISKRVRIALPAYRYRFRKALMKLVGRQRVRHIPEGRLILLADGLWFQFDGKPWVLYLTAIKACSGSQAVFFDPLLLPGAEGIGNWEKAIAAIPPETRSRIGAIVVDNLGGMQRLAREHGWVLQLCQFHLIMKFQVHRRGIRKALKGGLVREEIYDLVRESLVLDDGPDLETVRARLHKLSAGDCGTAHIRSVVREFLQNFNFYRSHRVYPELALPTTNNALESMGRLIREMFRRSRSGSNPKSILLWATALIRMRSKVTCNG